MNVLVFNSGSSSLKFSLFIGEKLVLDGLFDAIGQKNGSFTISGASSEKQSLHVHDHEHAVTLVLSHVQHVLGKKSLHAIAHRVVHGGTHYITPVKITKTVLKKLKGISFLAPLHNPHNIKGIELCGKYFKGIPQVAVFDTAFHATLPKVAYMYPLPSTIVKKYHLRKYGFHGISYAYIVSELAKMKRKKKISDHNKTIICHMGNGISITAVKKGKSVETSMGFTPLDGMPMGTRAGALDPGLILFLQKEGYGLDDITTLLNKESGLKAIVGSSDMRTIHKKAIAGEKKAKLAIDYLAYRAFRIIGSYSAVLNGLHALVFTGGMGEGAFYLRTKICAHLSYLGLHLDTKKNECGELHISRRSSKVNVLVMHTNEGLQIAREARNILK